MNCIFVFSAAICLLILLLAYFCILGAVTYIVEITAFIFTAMGFHFMTARLHKNCSSVLLKCFLWFVSCICDYLEYILLEGVKQ